MMYEKYIRKAIKLAKKAKGSTHPNPMVGALIVKNNRVIASGFHKKAGKPHAEIIALSKAGKRAKGATLFVTLEPCSNFGRTPPCVDEIIKSGIREVVIGTEDPNPINRFKGINKLRAYKIKVVSGVLRETAYKLNRDYAKYITEKRPYITIKVAQSLDGKMATRTGDSKWISSYKSRKYAHKLRAENDAVLVGINTVLKDNPMLNVRLYKSFTKQPKKVILDSGLRIPKKAKLLSGLKKNNVIIATTSSASKRKIKQLKNKGITVIKCRSKNKRVDLGNLMDKLAGLDIVSILVEGGSRVITSFIKQGLADRMVIFISPKIIGGEKAPTFYEGKGIKYIKDAYRLKNIKYKRMESDLVIEGSV